ncbi:MAG: hypothetical protein GVY15_07600, partial [Bacteroidetes bacterium]|nr:hypothetical protein [Bacteroidota bacterium]
MILSCAVLRPDAPVISRVHLISNPIHMPDEDYDLPTLTTAQMREVDRLMVDTYGIALLQMMEHAGRHLAHLARHRFLGGAIRGTGWWWCWPAPAATGVAG